MPWLVKHAFAVRKHATFTVSEILRHTVCPSKKKGSISLDEITDIGYRREDIVTWHQKPERKKMNRDFKNIQSLSKCLFGA